MRKYLAEMIGTMILVLMGCGSAVFAGNAAGEVSAGVGTLGVALAFGLSVVAMAYTIGNISGCHINPAITLGVWLSGKMTNRDAVGYMIFQIIGAIIGSLILLLLVSTGGHSGPTMTGANTFDPGETVQAFIAEAVFTFIFVFVVLGATDSEKGAGNLGVRDGLEHHRVAEERELLDDHAPLARLERAQDLCPGPALKVGSVTADQTPHGHASALFGSAQLS